VSPLAQYVNAQCTETGLLAIAVAPRERKISRDQMQVAVTAFLVLFCITPKRRMAAFTNSENDNLLSTDIAYCCNFCSQSITIACSAMR
jgi:hypothetical protein